jgi:hypothetical protein
LRRGQRLLAAAEVGESDAEIVQAHRKIGEEGIGSGREAPPNTDGLEPGGEAAYECPTGRRRDRTSGIGSFAYQVHAACRDAQSSMS